MENITLEQIHEDLIELKKDAQQIKTLMGEELDLADDLIQDIAKSRKRPQNEFISHEQMGNEFG